MKKRTAPQDWKETREGRAKYEEARVTAQTKANEMGFDFGIEPGDMFKDYFVFMLPRRENRYGSELRCEVVSCETLAKCQPGHGPC